MASERNALTMGVIGLDSRNFDGWRSLTENALPIPLDAAGLKLAGLKLSVKAARLLASLCLSDRIVLTGSDTVGCAGPIPPEIAELRGFGVPLSTDFFRLAGKIFVVRIRLDRPPFDLIDPNSRR